MYPISLASLLILTAPGPQLLEDFSSANRWTSSRDAARLQQENHHYCFDVRAEAGRTGTGLHWEFKVRDPKQGFNDLFSRFSIEEPFERVAIWVRNPQKKRLVFWIKLIDRDGADYAPQPLGVPIGGTDGWQRVEFPLAQYRLAGWSHDKNGKLDFPLQSLGLVVYEVNPGEEYQLDFDDLEVTPSPSEPVSVVRVEGPGQIRAGQEASLHLSLRAAAPLASDYPLTITWKHEAKILRAWEVQPAVATSRWKPGQAVALAPITFRVPQFAPGGRQELWARLGPTRLGGTHPGEAAALAQFEVIARQTGPIPRAEIRNHHGVPTLFVDGRPDCGMTYMTYNRQEPKYFGDFGKAGVHLATFSATSDFSYYGLAPPTWIALGEFDYRRFDERIVSILEANPRAYLFPRVYLAAPPWWCEANPDEVARQAAGQQGKSEHFAGKPFATPASEKWRRDTAAALRKFVEHVRSSPYADRVIGYHLASLHTEEWFYHNFWANPPSYWGYSRADRQSFQGWLQRRYRNVAALRAAWRDSRIDFSSITVPSRQARETTDLGFFRDPAKSQPVIDFYRYYNEVVVETVEYFARVVKDATRRESLCGAFYGYHFELSGSPEGGHLALHRLLHCDDIDFLTAPSSYAFRPLGTGASAFMSATEEIKQHGKLWFNENDYQTHLVTKKKTEFDYVDLKNLAESLAVQRRELAHTLSLGTAMWWFDMGGGWYDAPELMAAVAEMNEVARRSMAFDRSSVAEIAVVVDEESMLCRQPRGQFAELLLYQQRDGLHRIGAPFDVVFLDELEHRRPYRLYLFLNTFRVTAAQRAVVERTVKRDRRMAVWVYAPGFVDASLSDENMQRLTGIRLAHDPQAAPVKLRIAEGSDPITRDLVAGTTWGSAAAIRPVFFCSDEAATPLGTLEGQPRVGLAVKRFPQWTSVYCAAPNLPAGLLRGLARAAGVHLYNEADDVLYANRSLLGIHTNKAGARRLRFLRRTSLVDVFAGRQVAADASEVKLELPARHTALFFQGTLKEWREAGKQP